MINILLTLLGYILIWAAVAIGRKEDSQIELFSLNWVIQIILIAVGVVIISNLHTP